MTLESCQRRAPFLQRNWKRGVNAFQNSVMGSTLSTPKHRGTFTANDVDAPPSKRRRLSSPDLDIDRLIASPRASENSSILRIEVLKIFHKDSKKGRSCQSGGFPPRDLLATNASCRILIFDVSDGWSRNLFCQSQVCRIVTFKNPGGPHRLARIDLTRPFHVPKESILINRVDDGGFDFSKSYKLRVELEAANGSTWPPLEARDFGMLTGEHSPFAASPKQQWVMSSEFDTVFQRERRPLCLAGGHSPQSPHQQTDYVMEIDLQWTTGLRPFRQLGKGYKPCIANINPDVGLYTSGDFKPTPDEGLDGVNSVNDANGANGANGVNGVNGVNGSNGLDGSTLHEDSTHEPDHEEELEGDQTPSRSLRTREKNKVYNLKVLSDQAQGKDTRRRAKGVQNDAPGASEGRITYYLPQDQPVCLDLWRCITCGTSHQSIEQLQLHFETSHPGYHYALETTSQGTHFRVSSHPVSFSSPTKTFQLGRAQKPFHIPSFLSGDLSWVNSRTGTDNNDEPIRSPVKGSNARSLVEAPNLPGLRTTTRRVIAPKKLLVPDIKQPLFHPVSKAQLKKGQELPRPTANNQWMLQKHKESIGDFTDVTPSEKEYIKRWDAFILQQSTIGAAYLPRNWLSFIRKEASWLVSREDRMGEFGKHMCALFVRDVLDNETVEAAFAIIDEARGELETQRGRERRVNKDEEANKKAEGPRLSPKAAQIRRNANGCTVCQLPVMGPRLLLCSNKECPHRLYHSDCAGKGVMSPANRAKWLCKSCGAPGESS